MIDSFLLKGFIIGLVFGVPAGVVGVLTLRRALMHGAMVGFVSGMGSSVADSLYACIGVFGLTLISDFLMEHQIAISFIGGIGIILMGISIYTNKVKAINQSEEKKNIVTYFLSSFSITFTNPATILSFMLAFSMFGIKGMENAAENIWLIVGVFLGTGSWWAAISVIASKFRNKITDNIFLKLNKCFAAIIVVFGISMILRLL